MFKPRLICAILLAFSFSLSRQQTPPTVDPKKTTVPAQNANTAKPVQQAPK